MVHSRTLSGAGLVVVAALVGSGVVATVATPAAAATDDKITGVVWQDNDSNGVYNSSYESLLAGITIRAVDDEGNFVTAESQGTLIDGGTGNYVLTVPSDATKWRVEASLPATGMEQWRPSVVGTGDGGTNGTTVQFVTPGATDADFSFQIPGRYTDGNPNVYVPMLQFGAYDEPNRSAEDSVGGTVFKWDDTGRNLVPQTATVPITQVGATNGIASMLSPDPGAPATVFAAAYMRRHAGMGPDGIGAIYSISPDGDTWEAETASAGLYVDLTAAGFDIDLGGPGAERPANVAESTAMDPDYDWKRDPEAYPYVGRAGLGLMTLSADGEYLWVVNLFNRSLIRIETDGDPADPVQIGEVKEFELDDYFPDSGDIRPYGVSVDDQTGKMYLTATNTAETAWENASSENDASRSDDDAERAAAREQMHGYVYEVTASETAVDLGDPVLDFPLDYPRPGANFGKDAAFVPWQTNVDKILTGIISRDFSPEPVLSSVNFIDGKMIVGIRDRTGDLFGGSTFTSPDPAVDDSKQGAERSMGDVLIATPNDDGTFTLENAGTITVDGEQVTGAGKSNPQGGPGGSGFFDLSWYTTPYEALGSVVVNPSDDLGVMTTGVHIGGDLYQEGTRRLNQKTGEVNNAGAVIRTTAGTSVTSKGNGLGAATLIASAAPIEIGNYVWYDVNKNGVQDPGEDPVIGATVNLYEVVDGVPTLVSSKLTDGKGEYYFSSEDAESDTISPLKTGKNYVIAVDNAEDYESGGPLFEWAVTVPNQTTDSSGAGADAHDSDGIVDPTQFGALFGGFPFLTLTTGGPGENNHTYDFGFNQGGVAFEKRLSGAPVEDPEDSGVWTVEYDLVVTNPGVNDATYTVTDDLTGFGDGIDIVPGSAKVTGGPPEAEFRDDWNGVDALEVLSDPVSIPAGASNAEGAEVPAHVYTVTVQVTLQKDAETGVPTVTPGQLECTEGQTPEGDTTGLFNSAILTTNEDEKIPGDACAELSFVSVKKDVAEGFPRLSETDPTRYEVAYDLTVTNETAVATDYDLSDTLAFGDGAKIVDGSVTAKAVTTDLSKSASPSFNGVENTVIVTDQPIAGDAVHTYRVLAQFTVDIPMAPQDGAVDPSKCVSDPTPGSETGLHNGTTVMFNGYPGKDDACADFGDVTHIKELVSADKNADGAWTVVYKITVASTGAEKTTYSLDDELHFGEGITIVDGTETVTVTPEGVATVSDTWDGQSDLRIASDVPILGTDDDGYTPHVYTVTVDANVPSTFGVPINGVDPTVCGEDPVDYGNTVDRAFLNVSTLSDPTGDEDNDDACAPVPGFASDKTGSGGSALPEVSTPPLAATGQDASTTALIGGAALLVLLLGAGLIVRRRARRVDAE